MSLLFKPNGTLNVATDPCDLEQTSGSILTGDQGSIQSFQMARCKNLRLDQTGVIKTRDGSTVLGSVDTPIHKIIEQGGYRYTFASTQIYKDEVSIETGLVDAAWSAMLYNSWNDTNEQVFCTNGIDRKRIQDDTVYEWGIDAPSAASVIASGSVGELTGAYNAVYTYARKDGDTVICESNPSDEPAAVEVTDGHLQIHAAQPTDTQVTHIRFYRTLLDGGLFYYDYDVAIDSEINDTDFAISKAWEDDGLNGLQTIPINGSEYSYSHSWERTDGYISGDGFMFTTAGTTTDYAYTWESNYNLVTTISSWTVTGQDDYQYADNYSVTELGYYIDGDSNQFTDSLGYTYSWEPYYLYTDEAYALIEAMVQNVPMHGWEDQDYRFYILSQSDGGLGAEVSYLHDRPPLNGTFLIGPNFNGTCFMIVGNLLYYCLPKQPEYWPTSYYIEIGPVQYPGQNLVFFNGTPHFLTKPEIYNVQGTGADSFFPYRMNALTGAQGRQASCSVHGQGIYHVGSDGMYLFNGSEDHKITQPYFEPIFRGETVGGLPGMTGAGNSWVISLGNRLFLGYVSTGYTYPTNVLVWNVDTGRVTYYSYAMQICTVEIDEYNNRIIVGDSEGNVWHLDDPDASGDDGTAISWEVQSKDFMLQTRANFPRWCKYDVDASDCTATGQVILEDAIHQSHTLTGIGRTGKKRLVTTGNGQRMALRLTGSGAVKIFAVEAE